MHSSKPKNSHQHSQNLSFISSITLSSLGYLWFSECYFVVFRTRLLTTPNICKDKGRLFAAIWVVGYNKLAIYSRDDLVIGLVHEHIPKRIYWFYITLRIRTLTHSLLPLQYKMNKKNPTKITERNHQDLLKLFKLPKININCILRQFLLFTLNFGKIFKTLQMGKICKFWKLAFKKNRLLILQAPTPQNDQTSNN